MVGRGAAKLARAATAVRDLGELADVAAAALIEDPEVRQAVLEEREASRRADLVVGELLRALLKLRGASGPVARG